VSKYSTSVSIILALIIVMLLQVYVSSVSFNGSGKLEYNRVFPVISEKEDLSIKNFNSFSLQFTTNQTTTGLFYVNAKVSTYDCGSW